MLSENVEVVFADGLECFEDCTLSFELKTNKSNNSTNMNTKTNRRCAPVLVFR
jgi:hypothetical protein